MDCPISESTHRDFWMGSTYPNLCKLWHCTTLKFEMNLWGSMGITGGGFPWHQFTSPDHHGEAPHPCFAQFVPPPWGLKPGTPGWVWKSRDVICTKWDAWAAISVISYHVPWWTSRYLMLLLQDFIYSSIDCHKLNHICPQTKGFISSKRWCGHSPLSKWNCLIWGGCNFKFGNEAWMAGSLQRWPTGYILRQYVINHTYSVSFRASTCDQNILNHSKIQKFALNLHDKQQNGAKLPVDRQQLQCELSLATEDSQLVRNPQNNISETKKPYTAELYWNSLDPLRKLLQFNSKNHHLLSVSVLYHNVFCVLLVSPGARCVSPGVHSHIHRWMFAQSHQPPPTGATAVAEATCSHLFSKM